MDERQIDLELDEEKRGKYGTWLGVILPCLQNMLSILLFVRVPWIVGQAGIGMSLLILGICISTTIITTLSMNAVVTNGQPASGGAYYVLARSLGPSLGGSVGTLYYFGQSTSVSLYIIGAVELFLDISGDEIVSKAADVRILGLTACVLLWLSVVGAAGYIKRITLGSICILVLGLLSCYLGVFTVRPRRSSLPSTINGLSADNFSHNFDPDYDSAVYFNALIALFYPAVLGLFGGVAKSQDLRSPHLSLPLGTLLAIFIAFCIYLSAILLSGALCLRQELKENVTVLFTVAWPSQYFAAACVVVVTLGAALQGMSAASDLLVSIALDDILPLRCCKRELVALHLTALLIAGMVCIGSLNDVAPVITMFFLLFDASINFACVLLSLLNNPSWRPDWPFYHWTVAGVGCVLCVGVMLYINWWAALVAFVMATALYL